MIQFLSHLFAVLLILGALYMFGVALIFMYAKRSGSMDPIGQALNWPLYFLWWIMGGRA